MSGSKNEGKKIMVTSSVLRSFAPASNRRAMGPSGLKLRLANECSILSICYSYRGREHSKRKFCSTGRYISFRVDSSICNDAEELVYVCTNRF